MTEKRFHYDWKTGRFKDTQSNSCATTNMRVLETQINNACYNYEKKIKELEKENKELKERNNRQAKQLDNIYHLIEQRDWRALSDIIDDFKKAEEQLQQEWKCYE